MDPDLAYRDALLRELMDLERMQSDTEPLRFQFPTVRDMVSLHEFVDTKTPALRQGLILGTFRALRKDGIFYLLDTHSDTYLFISKDRVLEPYIDTITSNDIERGVERAQLRREPPPFLQQVPKRRVQYVRRNFKRTT